MKRFLSITLCVMMLVSVFSIGASAMVPTGETVTIKDAEEPVNYLPLQDFSAVEDASVYEVVGTGTVTVEPEAEGSSNNVLKLVTAASGASAVAIDNTKTSATLRENDTKMTVEFKVKPSVNTETLSVAVRMPYLKNMVNTAYSNKQNNAIAYAIYGPTFTANEWNTVKVEIDIPDGYAFGTNAGYPEAGADILASATITVNGTTLTRKNSGVSSATANQYHVVTATFGSSNYISNDPLVTIGFARTNPTTSGENTYLFDDIKVYKPFVPAVTEEVAYPINDGALLTVAEEKTYSASAMGFDNSDKKVEKVSYTGANMTANDCILTFDAKVNIDNGYPLTIQVSNGRKVGAVNIVANETSSSDWYTYKIRISDTKDGTTNTYINQIILNARKAAGTQDDLADLTWKWDILNSRTGSGADTGYVEFGYAAGLNTDVYDADLIDDTVWSVRNFQLIDADNNGAVTAKATANGDGTATVVANFSTAANAATPIVAVYDSVTNKLLDVAYAAAAYKNDGKFEATVKYAATGNTAKLFIWDGIATGVPVLANPIQLTVQ